MNRFNSDIDLDVPDRSLILEKIKHIPAAIREGDNVRRHNSGVYVTPIPVDYRRGIANIDYREAESRGYFKLDLLNVSIYRHVRNEIHMQELLRPPRWELLTDRNVVERLIHIHAHYDTLQQMPEPVNSIPRMAMFLSIIRPAKRHLIGKSWSEIAPTVWEPDSEGRYVFKKSHSVAYATLVVLNMNLYLENPEAFVSLV